MTTMTDFKAKPWLSAYAPGVPHEIPPVTETLVGMMAHSVREYDSRIALEFFGTSISYRQLGERSRESPEGLRTLGVGHGDRVALVLPNCPQHVVAFYAILSLGAIVVEHNPLYTADELRRQFEDHGATTAIVWDKVAATVLDFPAAMGVRTVIVGRPHQGHAAGEAAGVAASAGQGQVGPGGAEHRHRRQGGHRVVARCRRSPPGIRTCPRWRWMTSRSCSTPAAPPARRRVPSSPTRTCAPTRCRARPGCPDCARAMRSSTRCCRMFHSYGLTLCVTFAMSIGARLVLFPKFDEDLVLGAMKHIPATFLPAVPPIYQRARDGGRRAQDRAFRASVSPSPGR